MKKIETKSIYILCIYIVKAKKLLKTVFYLMGILWLWYGYPMERIDNYP